MHMHSAEGVGRSTQAVLGEEARHLHRCLFGCEALPNTVAAYLSAHAMLPELREIPPAQLCTVNRIVAARLDAVAIEPWLRQGRRRHALTSKLLLLAYLAECGGHHPPLPRGDAGSKFMMLFNGLRGGLGLLRGGVLKVRHGLF